MLLFWRCPGQIFIDTRFTFFTRWLCLEISHLSSTILRELIWVGSSFRRNFLIMTKRHLIFLAVMFIFFITSDEIVLSFLFISWILRLFLGGQGFLGDFLLNYLLGWVDWDGDSNTAFYVREVCRMLKVEISCVFIASFFDLWWELYWWRLVHPFYIRVIKSMIIERNEKSLIITVIVIHFLSWIVLVVWRGLVFIVEVVHVWLGFCKLHFIHSYAYVMMNKSSSSETFCEILAQNFELVADVVTVDKSYCFFFVDRLVETDVKVVCNPLSKFILPESKLIFQGVDSFTLAHDVASNSRIDVEDVMSWIHSIG